MKDHKFLFALATMVGTIVGVGIFGIPFALAQAGFLTGVFYLVFIGLLVLFVHLAYLEIILRTNESHRLVGYAAKYLGRGSKKITTLIVLIEYYGSLLAYVVIGGEFLGLIFSRWLNLPGIFWSLLFFAFGAAAIFWGLKTVAKSEFFMTGLLLFVMAVLVFKGGSGVALENLLTFDASKFFLPYGVILFSLAGSVAVPSVRQIMIGEERKIKKVVIWGTIIPAIVYLAFAWIVVGVSGAKTSEEAIKGLIPFLGPEVILIGSVFGILAIFTSFIVMGLNLKQVYQLDWRLKKNLSFLLACVVPLVLFLAGLKNFILIIGFLGAVAGGLDSILTILIFLRAKKEGDRRPEFSIKWGRLWASLAILLFSLGIIYQFVYWAG